MSKKKGVIAAQGKSWNETIQEMNEDALANDSRLKAEGMTQTKPHIEDLFTVVNNHLANVRRALNESDYSPARQQAIRDETQAKFAEWGIEDVFNWGDPGSVTPTRRRRAD